MALLSACEAVDLHDVPLLEAEVVHRAQLQVLLLCDVYGVLHLLHQVVEVKWVVTLFFLPITFVASRWGRRILCCRLFPA